MKKRPNVFLRVLDFAKAYWPILAVAAGVIGTAIMIPARLTAVEKKVETKAEQKSVEALADQTTALYEWVQAQEKANELQKKAPPGFRWDETAQEYIVYKDDPRLKRIVR